MRCRFLKGILVGFASTNAWNPWSWQSRGVPYQLPSYGHDMDTYHAVIHELQDKPPFISPQDIQTLRKEWAEASMGKRFLLTGGDCAETFQDFSMSQKQNDLLLMRAMSWIVSYRSCQPVTVIGRWAGQFAKPRSSLWDDEADCPAYQGDIINDVSAQQRTPDPKRMLTAYEQSVKTTHGLGVYDNYGDHVATWLYKQQYCDEADHLVQAIQGIEATTQRHTTWGPWYSGHECLLLPYESALTRLEEDTSTWYDTSAHFLWLGERTRRLNASHVEFLRGIHNPVGIKISGQTHIEELKQIVSLLNPRKQWGKIMIISRMGAGVTPLKLPSILRALDDQPPMVWCVDPMHGNTFVDKRSGKKTRRLSAIHQEIREFFNVMNTHRISVGGLHLELTSQHVTECLGRNVDHIALSQYHSVCDPRLNAHQALDTAALVADLLLNG